MRPPLHDLAQVTQEFPWLVIVTRKDFCQVFIAHVAGDGFSDDLAEVGGQRQVAAFVELRLIEARPASVDPAAFYRATKNEHYVGVTVVGAAVAVFARGAAKLRHGDHDRVFAKIAEIGPEGRNRLREIGEHVG